MFARLSQTLACLSILSAALTCQAQVGQGNFQPAPTQQYQQAQQYPNQQYTEQQRAQLAAQQRAAQPQQQRPQQQQQRPQQQLQRQQQQRPAQQVPKAPFQLTQAEQQQLVFALQKWEQRSNQIDRFSCTFHRFEYDPLFGPKEKDPRTNYPFAKTIETGELKYQKPDKGLFKVTRSLRYRAGAGEAWPYIENKDAQHETWICDGQYVFEYDYLNKVLVKRELPPSIQGQAIAEGPLPFLFGAKANKLLNRYWMKLLPSPKGRENEVWLKAIPKRQADAANYQMVLVILDIGTYLPKALRVFPPGYDPVKSPTWTSYALENSKENERKLTDQINFFSRSFYAPATPSGWKLRPEPYRAPQQATLPQRNPVR
jgi:TIGR03009 family protein